MKKSIAILFTLSLFNIAKAQQQKSDTMTEKYSTDSVISKDGTIIGYKQIGHGAGIILLHGTFESAASHNELAEALADSFTVYIPDRRCRGMSSYYTTDFDIQKDIEDLDALLNKTGAHFIFAVSSGAIITLRAALVLPSIQKIALWEPPLCIDTAMVHAVNRYNKEIADGKITDALVTSMQAGKFAPKVFDLFPRFILRGFTNKMMKGEESKAKPEDVTMRKLAPTVHHDFQIILENASKTDDLKNVKTQTLLLGGSKSPKYLKQSVDLLENILPNKKRIELPGLNHGGTGSSEWGGNPKLVAKELFKYFI